MSIASAEDPRKALGAGCDKWGIQRLELALVVQKLLDDEELTWFIESGTLLGAWRNGKFIPHDDDFDIALILSDDQTVEQLHRLNDKLDKLLPAPYKSRVVTSYCDKVWRLHMRAHAVPSVVPATAFDPTPPWHRSKSSTRLMASTRSSATATSAPITTL